MQHAPDGRIVLALGDRQDMGGRSRRNTLQIVLGSTLVHAGLIALIAVQSPRLLQPATLDGPPEPVIPILIMPRALPSTSATPRELRLHRRPQRFVAPDAEVKPLVVPNRDVDRPALPGPTLASPPMAASEALATNARNALRGRIGCANAAALGLSRAERQACDDQLAKGASSTPFAGLGIERGKAGALASAAARRESDFKYKRTGGPPGTVGAGPSTNGNAVGRGNNLPGQTAEDLKRTTGNDRGTLTVPF